jgi:hypothetical protein
VESPWNEGNEYTSRESRISLLCQWNRQLYKITRVRIHQVKMGWGSWQIQWCIRVWDLLEITGFNVLHVKITFTTPCHIEDNWQHSS